MKILQNISLLASAVLLSAATSYAGERDDSVTYSAAVFANASTGRYAPYMIGSWNGDRTTMKNGLSADFSIEKAMLTGGRFSWGAGAEIMAGYNHSADYARYDEADNSWTTSVMRPAAFTIRSLYAEAHYRCLYALAGMKTFHSKIVDDRLSSGDLVRSNNARPVPGLTIGFVDFQDIPFTNGWLQIDGQIMYGKFFDNDYRRKQFNYYAPLIATDIYYTYKYCYFRTKPTERFSATFGMQTAGQFGGQTEWFSRGRNYRTEVRGFRLKDVIKMFFPIRGNGNAFYEGNSVGAWSLRARYRLFDNSEIAAYWENFFEDGSGIACRNGADGLYGVQYTMSQKGWFTSAVVEYLDFRNQSGPLHYAPGDHESPSITTEATGGDNYYNNDTYGSYVNYGMAIGSPMVMAPIYNSDGYPEFIFNRMRGVHLAALGSPTDEIDYKIMFGWQKGYAMGRTPLPHAKTDVSAMIEVDWKANRLLEGLSFNCRVAIDRGELRGDNFGAALAVRYTGSFNFKK